MGTCDGFNITNEEIMANCYGCVVNTTSGFCPTAQCLLCSSGTLLGGGVIWGLYGTLCFGQVPDPHISGEPIVPLNGSCVQPKLGEEPNGCPRCWRDAVPYLIENLTAECFHSNISAASRFVV